MMKDEQVSNISELADVIAAACDTCVRREYTVGIMCATEDDAKRVSEVLLRKHAGLVAIGPAREGVTHITKTLTLRGPCDSERLYITIQCPAPTTSALRSW